MNNEKTNSSPNRLLKVLAIVAIAGLGLGGSVAGLNHSGFCFAKAGYVSDQERIRPTVETVLAIYPKISYAYDELPQPGFEVVNDKQRCCGQGDNSKHDKSKGGTPVPTSDLIPYRDMDEFFKLNPDCCSFTREGLYGELGNIEELWPKISGQSAGFVNVKFRVRYRDKQGNITTKFSAVSSHQDNCGRFTSPL